MPPPAPPAVPAPELVLKTVPPRPPHGALARPQLGLDAPVFAHARVIGLAAGAGWGKSALLAQWRRAALDGGALVAWLTAGPADEPGRLVQALALSLDRARGLPPQRHDGAPDAIGAATAWLAASADLPHELLLLIDEVDSLPAAGADLLRYVLHNLPPNLRVALAGRGAVRALAAGLDPGESVVAGPGLLALSVEEACALAVAAGSGADDGARLHESMEGWPLGLQMALRARSRAQRLPDHRGLMASLLDALPAADHDFLLQVAHCDVLYPALCAAVTCVPEAPATLARLAAGTPLFTEADDGEWVRLHALAREVLRDRQAARLAAAVPTLHLRASAWFEQRGMLHAAARHAHAAGATGHAIALAEQALPELVRSGQVEALADWQALLPADALRRRPRLRLALAWSLALSERPARAVSELEALAAGADPALRFEAALAGCAAHVYADAPDAFAALFQPWDGPPPPASDAWLRRAHANRRALLALLQGRPAEARRHLGPSCSDDSYGGRWGDLLCGLSFLWQGQARLAADVLQPALQSADAALGRRHPLSTMLAAVLAAALYDIDHLDAAQLLLANRLDVLERAAMPDALLLGYLAAARIASAQEHEHRALDLCDALLAAGEQRKLARVCVAALGEQIRIHAEHERPDSCRRLFERMLPWAREAQAAGPLLQRQVDLQRHLAQARWALAARDWHAALAPLDEAAQLADQLQRGREAIEVMDLRARALARIDGSGAALAREAAELARTYGLVRAVRPHQPPPPEAGGAHPGGYGRPLSATAAGASLLTPKEREVLELLARKLSNKEISRVLAVSEETVKWHLKNLFAKLEAGSRRHAVSRAVMLGLLE